MTDKEKLKEVVRLAYGMYYAAQYMTTDASRLRRAMDAYHQFIITEYNKQEPASEDLVDTTQTITYKGEVYTRCYKDKLDAFACKYPMLVPKTSKRYAKYSDVDLTIAVKEGAKWQKEQMMKNAVEGYVARDKNMGLFLYKEEPVLNKRFGGFWQGERSLCIPRGLFPEQKWDDRPIEVKVIIIKE